MFNTTHIRKVSVGIIFFLLCHVINAYAGRIEGFESCDIVMPTSVTQGKPFNITYVLTASNWEDAYFDDDYPLVQKDLKQKVKEPKNKLPQLIITVQYVCWTIGKVPIPRLHATVSDMHVTSKRPLIYVKPNSQWGNESMLAQRYLRKHGADSLQLEVEKRFREITVFSDRHYHAFAVVANQRYRAGLANPILAYSTESPIELDSTTLPFVKTYSEQLHLLNNKKGTIQSFRGKKARVEPLLGENKWHQKMPYNMYAPTIDTARAVVGCVPVAVGQVLHYHAKHQPIRVTGHPSADSWQPQWEQMQDSYQKTDSVNTHEVALLLRTLGNWLHTQYGLEASSTSGTKVKPLLIEQFGFSPEMRYFMVKNDNETVASIYDDLMHNRPVLASTASHMFVIDGCKEGFLHFNMGWNGQCNGYFQLPFCKKEDGSTIWCLTSFFSHIEPQQTNP